ncbi:MAG: hypothetical protein C4520_04650 [Candidatus Abyssobacteria bacterium SURF_5]|uniref:Uncharacterized protein n=1 Tax=Abyssobacteria bacterium (strain SURF_5) TaxID=2093360 RepID=A0A3A4NUP9_ABYX5|nr:MAG: hypothetical protein C4520_04650 [Candidatus Abyssubacteria bacterium SURF_5]
MRRQLLFLVFTLLLTASVHAVPLDLTSAGMEVIAPNQFILHNGLLGSKFYWGTFQWNAAENVFAPTGYGLKTPTFATAEYFPLHVGDSWTYSCSDGGTLTATITGTEQICGLTCMRKEWSNGVTDWYINDGSGWWYAKTADSSGQSVTYCPPLMMSPPQLYLGFSSQAPYENLPLRDSGGVQTGNLTGYYSFTGNLLEDVSVPAGTFTDCLRTNRINTLTETWGGGTKTTIYEDWWAKGAGGVKRVLTVIWATADGMSTLTYTLGMRLETATVGGITYGAVGAGVSE